MHKLYISEHELILQTSANLLLYEIVKLIGKPVIRFTGFKPVTGLQNVLPVTEF